MRQDEKNQIWPDLANNASARGALFKLHFLPLEKCFLWSGRGPETLSLLVAVFAELEKKSAMWSPSRNAAHTLRNAAFCGQMLASPLCSTHWP